MVSGGPLRFGWAPGRKSEFLNCRQMYGCAAVLGFLYVISNDFVFDFGLRPAVVTHPGAVNYPLCSKTWNILSTQTVGPETETQKQLASARCSIVSLVAERKQCTSCN